MSPARQSRAVSKTAYSVSSRTFEEDLSFEAVEMSCLLNTARWCIGRKTRALVKWHGSCSP